MLTELVIDKHKEGAFLDSGCANALVNTLKSMVQLGFQNDDFQQVILEGLTEHFDELDIVWATMLFKQLGQIPAESPVQLIDAMIKMAPLLHKKLK